MSPRYHPAAPTEIRETMRFRIASTLTAVMAALLLATACGEKAPPPAETKAPEPPPPPSIDPVAPDSFRVRFETSKGPVSIDVIRALSPRGVDRFHNLVTQGYFTNVRFFRVLPGFVAQFGVSGDPALNTKWGEERIPDEPVKTSNVRGTLTFAHGGANTRATQLFINYGDNSTLDTRGFPPIGRVVEGMSAVDKFYSGYGETGSAQGQIAVEGDPFLKRQFPKLDYIKSAAIVK